MRRRTFAASWLTVSILTACGGGDSGGGTGMSYTVGGTVTGLSGSGLVLTDNGGNALSVPANATSFTFTMAVASGDPFAVAVMAQPGNPSQVCTIAHGSGVITGNDITNVAVSCSTNTYTISGVVSGLSGTGLILTDQTAGTVSIAATGPFTFTLPKALASGTPYAVNVAQDPVSPPQGCSVASGSGTVQGSNVTGVTVTCHNASEELIVSDTFGNAVNYLIDPSTGSIAPTGAAPLTSISSPIADATGTYVYAASNAGLNVYTVDSTTAGLVLKAGPITTGSASDVPAGPNIDPTGRFLYSGSNAGEFAFTRDSSTGGLTPVAGSSFPGVTSIPGATVIYPGAAWAYALTAAFLYYPVQLEGCDCFELQGFAINSSTGALTALTFSGPNLPIVTPYPAVSPTGTFLFLAAGEITAYSIDATTGALTSVGNTVLQQEATGFALSSAGTAAYATDGASVYGYSVNGTTGALTAVAGSPFPITGNTVDLNIQGSRLVVFDRTGAYLYVANRTADDNITAFAIDSSTGVLTRIAATAIAVTTAINGPYTLAVAEIP